MPVLPSTSLLLSTGDTGILLARAPTRPTKKPPKPPKCT